MQHESQKRDYIATILAIVLSRARESYKHHPNFEKWMEEVENLDEAYQQKMVELLEAFNKDYRQPITDDGTYNGFVGLIKSILVSIGNTGYDINGSDMSIKYLTAILGTLQPCHMPANVDHKMIVRNCLRKRVANGREVVKRTIGAHCVYPLKAPWWWSKCEFIAHCTYWRESICDTCGEGDYNMFAEIDDGVDSPLYQYLQYVRVHEGGGHRFNKHFKDDHKTYWSGVVYYLMNSGCRITPRCIKMALNFKDCERCVKITKDILFVTEMDSICSIMNHTIERAIRKMDRYTGTNEFVLAVRKTWVDEKALFYQLIDNEIFCQHGQCMRIEYNPNVMDRTIWQTLEAALRTPKSLRSFCRRTIRLSLTSGKVVESCYKLPIPRPQADYVSLKALRTSIAKFYGAGETEGFDTAAAGATFCNVLGRYQIEADKDNIFW